MCIVAPGRERGGVRQAGAATLACRRFGRTVRDFQARVREWWTSQHIADRARGLQAQDDLHPLPIAVRPAQSLTTARTSSTTHTAAHTVRHFKGLPSRKPPLSGTGTAQRGRLFGSATGLTCATLDQAEASAQTLARRCDSQGNALRPRTECGADPMMAGGPGTLRRVKPRRVTPTACCGLTRLLAHRAGDGAINAHIAPPTVPTSGTSNAPSV